MFKRYGGQIAKKGLYWNFASQRFLYVEKDGEVLPGSADRLYLGLNIIELCFLGLLMGGTYVIFLPIVGYVYVMGAILVLIVTFISQKILCKLIRRICDAEHWLCDITHRFCKQCGKDCEDDIAMLVKAFIYSLFLLSGALLKTYL